MACWVSRKDYKGAQKVPKPQKKLKEAQEEPTLGFDMLIRYLPKQKYFWGGGILCLFTAQNGAKSVAITFIVLCYGNGCGEIILFHLAHAGDGLDFPTEYMQQIFSRQDSWRKSP